MSDEDKKRKFRLWMAAWGSVNSALPSLTAFRDYMHELYDMDDEEAGTCLALLQHAHNNIAAMKKIAYEQVEKNE